jgi:CheY-like chemotaxis protein
MARILIIEDNADHRQIFKRFLEVAGHLTNDATSGTDGIAAIALQPPELVVLDLRLRDMEGWEVARVLRSKPHTQHIPILIITAEPITSNILAQRASEYDALLLKPFDGSIFLSAVTRLLAHHPLQADTDQAETPNQRSVGGSG